MAPNNRQLSKRIESLQRRVDEHKLFIVAEPESLANRHWRSEIGAWETEIKRLRARLRR